MDYEDIDDSQIRYFSIQDMIGYCTTVRQKVGTEICSDIDDKELDGYITIGQIEKMVDDFCDDHDEDGYPIVSEESHSMICDAVMIRINNVGLAKMASSNVLQVAFDEQLNDFVFWADG